MSRTRQKQLQIELLELELHPALHLPALADVTDQLIVQGDHEFSRLFAGRFRIAGVGVHEQAVRVSIEDVESRGLEPAL